MSMPRPTTRRARLLASLRFAYARAIAAEESATSERQAWKLAKRTAQALYSLREVEAGRPLPDFIVMNARGKALVAFRSLATIGLAIARVMRRKTSLAMATAASKATRIRRALASLRNAVIVISTIALNLFRRTPMAHRKTTTLRATLLQYIPVIKSCDRCNRVAISDGLCREHHAEQQQRAAVEV